MTLRIDGKVLGFLTVSLLATACGGTPDGEPAATEETAATVKVGEPGEPVGAKPSPTTPPLQPLYQSGSTGHVVCVPKCPVQCDPSDPSCVEGSSGGSGDEHTQE